VLRNLEPKELTENPTFKAVAPMIPGQSQIEQLGFVSQSFNSVQGWIGDFVTSRQLTPEKVVNNLQRFVELSKDNLDVLGAFLDLSTNYYYHTGVQTLARRLIERAVAEI
jgi:hypothetical protein